jgi:hypothetical protein
LPVKEWIYLSTVQAGQAQNIEVEMLAFGNEQPGKVLSADVLKISALVRARDLFVHDEIINFQEVSQEDTSEYILQLFNRGIKELNISGIESVINLFQSQLNCP